MSKEGAPKVIESPVFPGIKIPATKEGWKNLMVGKDSAASGLRAYVSLEIAFFSAIGMTLLNIDQTSDPAKIWYLTHGLSLIGQGVLTWKRGKAEVRKEEIKLAKQWRVAP